MGDAGFAGWVTQFHSHRSVHARADAAIPFEAVCHIPPALRQSLIRSVQRFQLGESGDGGQLLRKAASDGDSHYLDAVKLFVAEEQQHAALLMRVLTYLGGEPIPHHWTDAVFVRLRRTLGLKTELMVLMVAEVIALHYYGMLACSGADPVVGAVAGRILADEQVHVGFHRTRLRHGFARASAAQRGLCWVLWTLITLGTATVVAIDHGRLLNALGYRRLRFVGDVMNTFLAVAAEVLDRPHRA